MSKLKVGVVGCGNISGIYLENLLASDAIEIVGVTDLDDSKSLLVGEKFGICIFESVEKMFTDPSIDAILNLTVPLAHAELNLAAIHANKHVYCEKPLALNSKDAFEIVKRAEEFGVKVGCAPDTFLGAGIQTCRNFVKSGKLGEVVAAQAFMICPGHESWHPSPEFYYEPGGGPMFDMGPYYVTALVELLGSAKSVSGMARVSFPYRTITSQPLSGQSIKVQTPTHITGSIEFESGCICNMVMSFDCYPYPLPHIILYGSEGTLIVPDPNQFGGEILFRSKESEKFEVVPLDPGSTENLRGIGLIEMARSIETGAPFSANSHLAAHVVEIMEAFLTSSTERTHISIVSRAHK